ncbi:L-threonylcarbamoyladenylate synthase (plasmid) [Pseudoalteromonas sp. T1lg65]|uniref:L-threonylcarbamoyladenylate synthase n=1 Tax=Pseudoalteromonas sp. T1lg65 TaxID=2077101 RepID=UPI003F79B1F7
MHKILSTSLLQGEHAVSEAVALLTQGECVGLPTETVYGLAADASNDTAVNKIFEAKGRPKNHPLIVHIPDVTHIERWAKDIPEAAYLLAAHYWPGPLTLLLKKADHISNVVTGGLDTIGLRVPAHPLFLQVLTELNGGLAAPSANRYKQLSPTIAEQVLEGLDGRIAAVLEGGACEHGLESTIIDLLSATPRILRAGPIAQAQLENVLGCPVAVPYEHVEVVPGNVKAHYQPNTPLAVLSPAELLTEVYNGKIADTQYVLSSSKVKEQVMQAAISDKQWRFLGEDAATYGSKLYVTLYELDKLHAKRIVVEQPPVTEQWRAVNDRLSRAASSTTDG